MESITAPRRLILSALSGLFCAISYPGFGFEALVWVALIPLLLALKGQSIKSGFKHGWVAGYVFFLGILPWLLSLWDWASIFILFGYVFLCAALGVLWGVWGMLAARLSSSSNWQFFLIGSGGWVLIEFFKEQTAFGFGWGTLGYTLHAFEPLLQWASITGVWGLSWLIVIVNFGLFFAWMKRDVRWFGSVLLLLIAAGMVGNGMLTQTKEMVVQAPKLNVALVQPSINQRDKSNPNLLEPLRETYLNLMRQLDAPLDMVILPESILPTLILEDDATYSAIQAEAKRLHAELLVGSFTRRDQDLFNSVILASETGGVQGVYDKVQLVPFSTEYFPMIDQIKSLGLGDWLTRLPLGALTRGAGYTPLISPKAAIGTPICFETSFTDISRQFVLNGAQVLMSVTNDAWFKDSLELEQHFIMGKVRAVETGRGFVQSANTGLSGIVLPTGEVSLMMEKLVEASATGNVPILNHQTIYVRWGSWWVFVVSALAVIAALTSYLLKRRTDQSSQPSE